MRCSRHKKAICYIFNTFSQHVIEPTIIYIDITSSIHSPGDVIETRIECYLFNISVLKSYLNSWDAIGTTCNIFLFVCQDRCDSEAAIWHKKIILLLDFHEKFHFCMKYSAWWLSMFCKIWYHFIVELNSEFGDNLNLRIRFWGHRACLRFWVSLSA